MRCQVGHDDQRRLHERGLRRDGDGDGHVVGAGVVKRHGVAVVEDGCHAVGLPVGRAVHVPEIVCAVAFPGEISRSCDDGAGGRAGFGRVRAEAAGVGRGDDVIISRAVGQAGVGEARAGVGGWSNQRRLIAAAGAAVEIITRRARNGGPDQGHLSVPGNGGEAGRSAWKSDDRQRGGGRNARRIFCRDFIIIGSRSQTIIGVGCLGDRLQISVGAARTGRAADDITHGTRHSRPAQGDVCDLDEMTRQRSGGGGGCRGQGHAHHRTGAAAGATSAGGGDEVTVNAPVRRRGVRIAGAGVRVVQNNRAQRVRRAAAGVHQGGTIDGVKIPTRRWTPIERNALVTDASYGQAGGRGGGAGGDAGIGRCPGAFRRVGARPAGIDRLHDVIISRAVDGIGIQTDGVVGAAAAHRTDNTAGRQDIIGAGRCRAVNIITRRAGSRRPGNQIAVVAWICRRTPRRRRHITRQLQPDVIIHEMVREISRWSGNAGFAKTDGDGVGTGMERSGGKRQPLISESAIISFANVAVAAAVGRPVTARRHAVRAGRKAREIGGIGAVDGDDDGRVIIRTKSEIK